MQTPNRSDRRLRRTAVRAALLVGALSGLVAGVPTSPAHAAPIDDLRAQASQLQNQIDEIGTTMSAVNEQIKASQERLDEARKTIAESQAGIAAAHAEVARITGLVNERAASVYRKASTGGVNEFDTDIRQQTSRRKYANAATQREEVLIDQLDRAKEDLASRQSAAETLEAEAAEQKSQLTAQRAEFAGQQAALATVESRVNGEIAEIVAQENARRRAAEAAAAAAARPPAASGNGGGGAKFDASKVPPASGSAGIAIAFASAQMQAGIPYCTGGKGPDCYDCSGLTQAAWGAAGVSMPGSSFTQYAAFPKIPMDQIQPGDLVFFGNLGHVGIYAGGGSVLNAPSSGKNVTIHPISYYSLAVRPG